MKIAAIGGEGFIGRHFVEESYKRGHETLVIDLQEIPSDNTENYRYTKCNVFDENQLHNILSSERPDIVVSFIGMPDAGKCNSNPSLGFKLNVTSVERVWDTIKTIDSVRLGVLISTAAVYGNTTILPVKENSGILPTSIYGWQKWLAEQLVTGYSDIYGPKSIVVRLFNAYGKGQAGIISHLVAAATNKRQFNLFGSKQLRDFVYIGDVSEALVKICESPIEKNQTFNIGSGQGTRIEEIGDWIRDLCGQLDVIKSDIDSSQYYDSVADITKIKDLIQWNPISGEKLIKNIIEREMLP